jgi:hypothetical protein
MTLFVNVNRDIYKNQMGQLKKIHTNLTTLS